MKTKSKLYIILKHNDVQKFLQTMKITLFIFFLAVFQVSATNIFSQSPKISLNVRNATVREVIKEIERQGQMNFFYNDNLKELNKKVSVSSIDKPVNEVLETTLYQADMTYEVIKENFVILLPMGKNIKNQPITVSGQVLSAETNDPLPGVNVVVKGSTIGTITNLNGNFTIEVPADMQVLVFSFVGMITQEVILEGRTSVTVLMEEEMVGLDEVIVVGYGSMKKSDLTGSISSVERENIVGQAVYSIDNVLQGQSAGVQITAGGFRPGQTSSILIRGQRSLAGNNSPLIIIDGVPVESGLMDINPSDVEAVEILKDASSCAIYGSRAANGVILITTRRGMEGKPVVEYNGYAGPQYTFERLDLMDTPTYAQFRRDAYILEGSYVNDAGIFAPWQLEAIAENRTTDWQDLVFDQGFQQKHNLSVRGGTETTKYSISASLDDHKATVDNNDYKRLSSRFNVDQDLAPWLRVGLNAFLSDSKTHHSVAFQNVIKNSPMALPYDADGEIRMLDELNDRNPLFDMQRKNNLDERLQTRILGTLYGEITFIPERLTLRTTYSPDFLFYNRGTYRKDYASTVSNAESKTINTLYESILTYDDTYFEKHRLNVTAMYGIQRNRYTAMSMNGTGLPYEHQLFYNMASVNILDSYATGLSEWALESYMLRANYVFDDRYLLTLTGRVDGSSRMAEEHKYSLFPSMAVAWHIGNESFMDNVDIISMLKLRFSMGETGNTGIAPYQTQGLLSIGNLYSFSGQDIQYFEHGSIPNPDLKWERTLSKNLGISFGLWKNRLTGSIDVYDNYTYDLLMNRNLPYSTGYSSVLQNVGETRNKGIEVELSSINIQTNDFTWSTELNFAANRNEIVSLYGGKDDDVGNLWFIGEPINVNYYWIFDGIWQTEEAAEAAVYGQVPGNVRAKDLNDDGSINDEDRAILGSQEPSWIGGMTNRLQYKNIDLSCFIYTVQGTQHYSTYGSAGYLDLLSLEAHAYQDNMRDVQYWMPDRQSNEFQKPHISGQVRNNIQAYFNTSFVRVRNITLGYTLPENLISKLKMNRARVYTSVQNPFTFTSFGGYDPEAARGFDMPNYTTFLLGVDLTF